jgi:hypothetical protein
LFGGLNAKGRMKKEEGRMKKEEGKMKKEEGRMLRLSESRAMLASAMLSKCYINEVI